MSDPSPSLCDLWEQEVSIRAMARESACLTRWATPRVTGLASTGAMALNIKALEIMTEWWAGQKTEPQAVPIEPIRTEAWVTQKQLHGFITHYHWDCYVMFKV